MGRIISLERRDIGRSARSDAMTSSQLHYKYQCESLSMFLQNEGLDAGKEFISRLKDVHVRVRAWECVRVH